MNRNTCGALFAASLLGEPAIAQSDEVEIDLEGVVLDFPVAGDITRDSLTSPAAGSDSFILAADGYSFELGGLLQLRDPFFGLPLGDPLLLSQLVDQIEPGNARLLEGWVRNRFGGLPPGGIIVWTERFEGGVAGADLSIRFEVSIGDDGVVTAAVRDIESSLGGLTPTMDFLSGGVILRTWIPSDRQISEWHFDGDFETAAGSDDSVLRYLDEPAFGPILGGIGNETGLPNPPTPTGVTEAQSGFVDTAADPGIPAIGGVDAMAYRTSPAFNLNDPANDAWRRGIGLALYPSAMPAYPSGIIGQWSMIWDLYIPSESWFADFPANTQPREFLAALVQRQHRNGDGADYWLRNQGGSPVIVMALEGDDFTGSMPLNLPIAPDTWFRLGVVTDEFQTGRSRVFLDGAFVGEILSEWIYNAVDPTPGQQVYGDGEAVDPADWDAWGHFPSPWAVSSGTINPDPDTGAPIPVPLASTVCLFSDLRFGGSQPVYLANFLFVDDLLPDDEVIALGGPSGDGIMMIGGGGCNAADIAEPFGVHDLSDINAFIAGFLAQDPVADVAEPFGVFDLADINGFIGAFSAGCP